MKLFQIFGSGFHGCYLDCLVWANSKQEALNLLYKQRPKYIEYTGLKVTEMKSPKNAGILSIEEDTYRD